jgi:hypothetical protein
MNEMIYNEEAHYMRHGHLAVTLTVVLGLALALASAGAAFAADSDDPSGTAAMIDIGMSARALGMGGAHIAVADDASAVYYNPAGLAFVGGHNVTSLYTSLHGAAGYLALGYAQKNLGAGLLRLNASGVEETDEFANVIGVFNTTDLTAIAGYGREITPNLSLGGAIKLYSQKLRDASGTGITGDVGALYKSEDGRFRAGAVARNLFGHVKYAGGATDPFDRSFGVGAAFAPSDKFLLAADVGLASGLTARVGAEYQLRNFAVRAGGVLSGGDVSITAGAGFAMQSFSVDYAYQTHKVLPDSHRLSLSMSF